MGYLLLLVAAAGFLVGHNKIINNMCQLMDNKESYRDYTGAMWGGIITAASCNAAMIGMFFL